MQQLVRKSRLDRVEFILLCAAMTALDAFSIDAVLPALDQIGSDLNIKTTNHRQFVVTAIFSGFSVGVLLYGFFADRFGRRPPAMVGFIIYAIGSLACTIAETLPIMLAGRMLQGLGAAGPYVLSVAIVRDLYKGRDMAQILSLIMMVFICVPMIAPFLGQAVMLLAGWRSIFVVLLVYSMCTLIWFGLRQIETLRPENRQSISLGAITRAFLTVMSNRQALCYLLAMGAVFGSFIAYLSTAQQIFQEIYPLGKKFPIVFAALASVFGVGSFLNARWVHTQGSSRLVHRALAAIVSASLFFLVLYHDISTPPALWAYLTYLCVILFCFAFLFGNLTSLALEPMGHIAGSASSIINSASTLIAIILATLIGKEMQANVHPVVVGFAILCSVAWLLNWFASRGD